VSASSTLRAITDESFEQDVLQAAGPVLVDFWAEWCPPCHRLNPVLEQLAAEYPGLTIVKIDADDNPRAAVEYQAMSLPTLKVFRDGTVVQTLIGARPKAALESALAAHLQG
jgi:thioredoxin 1